MRAPLVILVRLEETMELEFGIIILVAVTILGSALGIAWWDSRRDHTQSLAGERK